MLAALADPAHEAHDYFFVIVTGDENDWQDWLAGYWPALMHNKPNSVVRILRTALHDKQLDWYPRSHIAEVLLAAAHHQGGEALEKSLDLLARIAADESEDWPLH